MSNDVSIAVVKADDAFYVEVIPGRSNMNKKAEKAVFKAIAQKQKVFKVEEDAFKEAKIKHEEFVKEFNCYPDYGIEILDWTHYAN